MMVMMKATYDMFTEMRQMRNFGGDKMEDLAAADKDSLWYTDCMNHTPLPELLPAKTKQDAWELECGLNNADTYKAVKLWIWLVYISSQGRKPEELVAVKELKKEGTKEGDLVKGKATDQTGAVGTTVNCLIRRFDCILEFLASYSQKDTNPTVEEQLNGPWRMVSDGIAVAFLNHIQV